ncbi:antibiotic biosynthesis monooxygenase [Sphingobium sp. H33]|uniref:Antibiotic biosynthesis monooxygenase n=2 Tax=Sphingobium nicotianae TaxID=2782607 RepID=A0A9X1DCG6_9SPHN|nr:antibiotic biosynthesis monooxygenase [Sphingobium nicotianae]
MTRREVATAGAGLALLALAAPGLAATETRRMEEEKPHYGLIGQIKALPGKRDDLIAILTEGSGEMPGNVAYIVGADVADADSIWITELWMTKEAHAASLKLPKVQEAIKYGRPLMAGFGVRVEFVPG